MLVFNEGVPRSGKSYDAVASHILPALKRGRRVFARLNGLSHEKIAAYLSMDVEDVNDLLTVVATSDVVNTFKAVRPVSDGDAWTIPAEMQNALFVIDEVHEFYVAGRAPLPEEVEQFFALHGQNGMDGVIMTQSYKRLHSVIRARIERKNQFQKLTPIGMPKYCRQTFFTTIAPDKYEKAGGKTFKYNPKIYPLYLGYAPGATNVDVYDGGGKSAFRRFLVPGLIIAVLAVVFLPKLYSFFHDPAAMVKTKPQAHIASVQSVPSTSTAGDTAAPVKSAAAPTREHAKFDTTGMPPEVAYVFDMSVQARPRVAAVVESQSTGRVIGVIEWREDQGHVLERMTFDELRSLGVQVDVKPYGVKVGWEKQVIVATRWPVDMPGTVQMYDRPTQGAAVATPSVSEPLLPQPGAKEKRWAARDTQTAYVPPELTSVGAISKNR